MRNLSFLLRIPCFFTIILLASASMLSAQQVTIVGRVTLFNTSKPLSTVTVVGEEGIIQQTETDNEGIFRVKLIGLELGKKHKINLSKVNPSKDKYEVVNEESLSVVAGQIDTVEIKMALSKELGDARQIFYNIVKTSMEKGYQEKIKALKDKLAKENGQQIKNKNRIIILESELENITEQYALSDQKAQELAKVLSYISLDNEPEIFVSAIKKLKTGEITLDSSCTQIEQGIAEMDTLIQYDTYKLKTNLEQKVVKWRSLKMTFYKSQLRFDDFDKEFQKTIGYQPEEKKKAELLFDYANFKGEWLKQYDTAIVYYIKANAAAQLDMQMPILNEWGNALYLKNELEQARKKFKEVLEIFVDGKAKSTEHQPIIAKTYVNLGMIYLVEQNYKIADSFFLRAEKIYQEEQSKDSTQLMPEFARLLTNRAINLRRLSKPFAEIENRYFKAIELYEKSNKIKSTNLYVRPSARVYDLLGTLYSSTRNYGRADSFYKKALDIQRTLVKNNPIASFKKDLANTTFNYGLNLEKLKDTSNAKVVFREVRAMLRAQLSGDSMSVNLNTCNEKLGDFYLADSLVDDALKLYETVYFDLKKSAYRDPSVYGKKYTDILRKMVDMNAIILKKEPENALRQNIAARQIDSLLVEFLSFQKMYAHKCDTINMKRDDSIKVNTVYSDLGRAYLFNKKPKEAEEAVKVALAIKRDKKSLWCLLFSLLMQNDSKKEREAKTIFQETSKVYEDKKLAEAATSYFEELTQTNYTDTAKLQKKLKRLLPDTKSTAAK